MLGTLQLLAFKIQASILFHRSMLMALVGVSLKLLFEMNKAGLAYH